MNKQSFDLSSLAPYAAPVGGAGIGGLLGYLLARDDEDSTPGILGALGGAGLGAGAGYLANPYIEKLLAKPQDQPGESQPLSAEQLRQLESALSKVHPGAGAGYGLIASHLEEAAREAAREAALMQQTRMITTKEGKRIRLPLNEEYNPGVDVKPTPVTRPDTRPGMGKQSFDLSSLAPYAAPVGGAGIGGLLGYLLARDEESSTPGILGALGGAGLGAGAGYLANPYIQSLLESSTEEPQVQGVTLDHKPDYGVDVKPTPVTRPDNRPYMGRDKGENVKPTPVTRPDNRPYMGRDKGENVKATKPKTSGTKPNTMPPTNENPERPVDKDKLREEYDKGQTKKGSAHTKRALATPPRFYRNKLNDNLNAIGYYGNLARTLVSPNAAQAVSAARAAGVNRDNISRPRDVYPVTPDHTFDPGVDVFPTPVTRPAPYHTFDPGVNVAPTPVTRPDLRPGMGRVPAGGLDLSNFNAPSLMSTLSTKQSPGVNVAPTPVTRPDLRPGMGRVPAGGLDLSNFNAPSLMSTLSTKQSSWEDLSPYLPAAGGAGVGGLLGYLLARDDDDSTSGLLGALAGAGIGGAGAHFGLPYLQKLLNKPETADLSQSTQEDQERILNTPTTTQALNRVNPHLGTGVAAATHMNEKTLNDFNSNQVALGNAMTAMAPGPYAAMASSPLSAAGRSANVVNGMVNKSLFNSVQ